MVQLWYTKIKLGYSKLEEVPERYYQQVKKMLDDNGIEYEE